MVSHKCLGIYSVAMKNNLNSIPFKIFNSRVDMFTLYDKIYNIFVTDDSKV